MPEPRAVASVRDSGAKGDGRTDDTAAFAAAVERAVKAGGGAILVPAGTYRLTGMVLLTHSGLVLRGEGAEKTILQFERSLTDVVGPFTSGGKCRWSWSGGLIWIGPAETFTPDGKMARTDGGWEDWSRGNPIAQVVRPARMGETRLEVDAAGARRLEPGRMALLCWTDPPDRSLLEAIGGHPKMKDAPWGRLAGTTWRWPVEVAAVRGTQVTLKQPLRLDVRPEWKVHFEPLGPHVEEVGVEGLPMRFPPHKVMPHLLDVGYNGPFLNRAIHCWVRGVTVENADIGYGVSAAKCTTATDLAIIGQPNHHATCCRNGSHDNLISGFRIESKPMHGLNQEGLGSGNVWRKGLMKHGTFDSHRAMSFDSIRTDITVTSDGRPGGAGDAGPFLGRRMVHWNVRIAGGNPEWINCPDIMSMGALVGIQGADIVHNPKPWGMPPGDKGTVVADPGKVPDPPDLFEAQLRLRLGAR